MINIQCGLTLDRPTRMMDACKTCMHSKKNGSDHLTQFEPTIQENSHYKDAMGVNSRSYDYWEIEMTSTMMWQCMIMPHVILK